MSERVAGFCPMGCGATLFLGDGGHVTCSYLGCRAPTKLDAILATRETEHVVELGAATFSVLHPLRERDDDLFACSLQSYLQDLDGPPRKPGRYRAVPTTTGWAFHLLGLLEQRPGGASGMKPASPALSLQSKGPHAPSAPAARAPREDVTYGEEQDG